MPENSGKTDNERRRRKRTRGSQTDEGELEENGEHIGTCISGNCHSQLEEINRKLDLTLSKLEELESIKERQRFLENENEELKTSLNIVGQELNDLKHIVKEQDLKLKDLTESMLTEKNRGIKIESHSRRNNLRFYKIPEKPSETPQDTENILRDFIETNLDVPEKEVNDISIERVHRTGPKKNGSARAIIAKFSFFKDKQYVLSQAKHLAGSPYGISEDFPPEIVEIRKRLYAKLTAAKKEGKTAKLVFDRLYIDGKLYIEPSLAK